MNLNKLDDISSLIKESTILSDSHDTFKLLKNWDSSKD